MPRKNRQRWKGDRGRQQRKEEETGPSLTVGQTAATPASSSCGSNFDQQTQEPKTGDLPPSSPEKLPPSSTEDLPLSVQEEKRSSVEPFNASCNLKYGLENPECALYLKIYFPNESDKHVLHYGTSSVILRGWMDDGTEVVIKRRPKSKILSSKSEAKLLRELKHPAIVGYIDYREDDEFTSTALYLVKSTLEEHIKQINSQKTTEEEKKPYLINLTVKVLEGLKFLHQQNCSHGDVRLRNVLMDEAGQPKWIDFTSSDRDGSKMKDEICRAGELAFYILSGGETYCGRNTDWKITALEWDFIEWMTKERKSLEEALDHPVFWRNLRKLKYLEALSNLNMKVTKTPQRRLNEVTRGKTFENWRSLVPPKLLMEMEHERANRGANSLAGAEAEARSYPEDVLGLLRFIRNVLQHRPEEIFDFLNTFPDLVESVYIVARDTGWNSRPSVMRVFSAW